MNLASIGRLKFEDYEVENFRPAVVSSLLMRLPLRRLGETRLARAIGLTEIAIAAMISTGRWAPRISAAGRSLAAGMFAVTLSFLVTTPAAWHQRGPEPKLSPAGQFLIKDVVLLGASLITAAESLSSTRRRYPSVALPAPIRPAFIFAVISLMASIAASTASVIT